MKRRLVKVAPMGLDLARASMLLVHSFVNPFLQMAPFFQPEDIELRLRPSTRIRPLGKAAFRAMVALALAKDPSLAASSPASLSAKVGGYCSYVAMAVFCVGAHLHTCMYFGDGYVGMFLRKAVDSFGDLVMS